MSLAHDSARKTALSGQRTRSGKHDDQLVVEHITDWQKLSALSPEWNELVSRSCQPTFFQTWEWVSSWWEAYQQGKEIFTYVLRDEGKLVGIAPLYRARSFSIFQGPTRVLRFIGDGSDDADNFGMIFDVPYTARCLARLFTTLEADRPEWDLLEFNSMPEESSAVQHLVDHLESLGWSCRFSWFPHLVVDLPDDWDRYLEGLSDTVKRRWRRKIAVAKKSFKVSLKRCKTDAQISDGLRLLMELHQIRWRTAGGTGKFASRERQKFYALLARRAQKKGAAHLHILYFDDRPAAVLFACEYGKTYFALQTGFHRDFSRYGAGTLLDIEVIQELIEEDFQEVDFLAGDESFKLEFGAVKRRYVNIITAPRRTRAGILLSLRSVLSRRRFRIRKRALDKIASRNFMHVNPCQK